MNLQFRINLTTSPIDDTFLHKHFSCKIERIKITTKSTQHKRNQTNDENR